MATTYKEVPMEARVYLTIPFNDKDTAKQMGCRFDPERKLWYSLDSNNGKCQVDACVDKWNTPEPYKFVDGEKVVLSNIQPNDRGFAPF